MKNFFKNLFRKEAGFVLVLLVSFFCFFSCADGVTNTGDSGTNTGGGTAGLNYNAELKNVELKLYDSCVIITWENPDDEFFKGVRIYKGDDELPLFDGSSVESLAEIENLSNGETYTFKICPKGVSSDGIYVEGKNSVYKTITLPETPEKTEKPYTGKISELDYVCGDGNVTFTWKNPEDENFTGLNIYVDGELYGTYESNETEVLIDKLENNNIYSISFVAEAKDSSDVEIESLNKIVKKIKIESFTAYNFIGRGYNAITGEYFCYCTGLKDHILEFSSDFKPVVESVNSSDTTFTSGQTLSSYKTDFNQKVGVEGGYAGFSASVDVDFGKTESFSEETSFASAYSMNKKEREYIENSKRNIPLIKKHLKEDFQKDLNDSSVTPEKLFATYGTHVLLDTYLGGRFAVNYTYKNYSRESSEKISVAVKANYEGAFKVGGSSETGFGEESSMTNENTSISGYSRGGKAVAFASLEQAVEKWSEWTESLNDSENKEVWSLIDSPETILNQDINTGIWLFAESESRRNEIRSYYLSELEKNASSFASKQTKKWIKSARVWTNGTDRGDYASVRKKVTAMLGHDNFIIAGENSSSGLPIDAFDLNKGLGGKSYYAYLVMELTTKKEEALRGVIGNSAKTVSATENVAYRNPWVDASLWEEVNIIDDPSSGGRYNLGKPNDDGYRVLFNSYKQNRDGTTGENAYIIKEIAVVNTSQNTSSQSKVSESYKIAEDKKGMNGNNITTDTGGDDIFLRIYYEEGE
ncbi:MAC/perforin domain-containing protein [Treponema berlinense]|uniref:MAC/perforin domain-containing protein n=1 Tax=Treponema berlinense TaxID=225004 RepID=UPI0026EF337C|nr:MAC/perforin domain-containing protein [Treponema berlinense]